MKLLLILSLILSLNGYGEIPPEGVDTTVTQAEKDFLTGEMVMSLEGSLVSTNHSLTVTITRSETDLVDEFCCAGQCLPGNEELSQWIQLTFSEEKTNWFVHYSPQPASNVTITYTFSDGTDERVLRVNYVYDAEGIEITNDKSQITNRKVLRNGIIYIETQNNIYHL